MPNPRAQKPLTLDQVKKDLLSFKEPATALADMTAGGLRGLTLGTFGMPGEIESLSRSAINAMLQTASPRATSSRGKDAPQISDKTFLPTMDELSKRWSPTIPEGVPDQKSRERSADFGETFGKLGVLPGTTGLYGGVYRGVKSIPAAFKHGALEFAKAAGQPSTNIVKSGGGNWLRQGLDEQRTLGDAGNGRALQGWNRQPPEHQARYPERQMGAVADDTVADWANKNMLKYMANQMGTKNDPVRKLAEQNISHFGMRPDEFGEFPYIKPSDETRKLRKAHTERTGEESPIAESSLAAYWENLSDNAIKATTVGDIKNAPKAGYSFKAKEDIAPYADKVPPETPIYNIDTGDNYQTARQSLGFSRLLEVMREDIAAGRVTPEEVAKWDMEQAVRHVDKRDKAIWKAEADEADRLAKEFARYFPVHKEYPDKSRWIELKVPEIKELPEGYKIVPYKSNYSEGVKILNPKGEQVSAGDTAEEALKHWGTIKLEDALRIEGEKMGHCVGGYCEDVAEGRTRIFSYRDANGDPHVTMEVIPEEQNLEKINRLIQEKRPELKEQYNANRSDYFNDFRYFLTKEHPEVYKEIEKIESPQKIMQIKGKEDRRPVDRYIPYVQDFQRSTKYPIEGDFGNSGFDFPATGPKGIFDEDQVKTLREAGHEVHDYLTKAEREDLVRKLYEKETGNNFETGEPLNPPEPPTEGMKSGGAVHISDNPDTMAMELQDQHYAGGGQIVRGLKALKMAMHDPEAIVSSARGATKFAEPAPKTMSVIKEKGGSWLEHHPTEQLKPLRKQTAAGSDPAEILKEMKEKWTPQEIERVASTNPSLANIRESIPHQMNHLEKQAIINNWVDSNLKNYVKNEMGTPNDPVRLGIEKRGKDVEQMRINAEAKLQRMDEKIANAEASATTDDDMRKLANMKRTRSQQAVELGNEIRLAEQHVTHLNQDRMERFGDWTPDTLRVKREAQGFPAEGMSTYTPARTWETIADLSIEPSSSDWIKNLAKEFETPNARRILAQNPWIENLRGDQTVYAGSKAPIELADFKHVIDVLEQDVASGRLRPEQLNKVSVEQAIARTVEYDKELAREMYKQNAKNMDDVVVHKEYPSGFRWVELNKPGHFAAESKSMGHSVKGYEPHKGHPDWVEGSGEEGSPYYGYGGWDAIKSGKAKVYSLVDQFNEPHVTIEVGSSEPKEAALKAMPKEVQDEFNKRIDDWVGSIDYVPSREEIMQETTRLFDQLNIPKSQEINQIKGKGNRRPVGKYDEYTQDFVKSGNWEGVRDLENTGLRSVQGKYYTEQELTEAAKKYGRMGVMDTPWEVARQRHMDAGLSEEDALANWVEAFKEGRGRLDIPPEGEGMKAGGKVHVSDNCDCMRMELDNKKFAMGGAVEGENDVGSPSPQNSASPVAGYQAGGAVKGLAALKQALTGGSAEAAKAARVAALRQSGLSVAEAKARVELAEQAAEMKQALKASEALAKIEGKHLNITQADRTKVGEGYLGGPGFSGLQMKEGPHKDVGAVWGVKNTGTAKTMLGGFDKPLGKEYFTTMIGSPTQHQSNQMVFDKLYKDFTAQAKKGNLDPELHQKINDRLASAVDKDGNAIFPPDIDILSKNFKKQASTFDQRAVAGNVLGGVGIGGKKGQIIDYEKIIRDTTDPFLLDTPSGDLGYRIWTPSGEVIERPDLHPAFPAIATGEDLGVEFAPADKNILLAPFLEKFRAEKGRDPGYMDMTRGRPARVQITEPLLKNLQESGNKAGGAVKATNKYSDGGAISALMKHAETAGQSARMNNQRM